MKQTLSILLMGMLLFPLGCSRVKINYDYDKEEDFSSFNTFDFMPVPEKVAEHAQALEPIRMAVTRQLEAKGFTGTSDNPDLLIAVHTSVEDTVRVSDWGYSYAPWGMYYGGYGFGQGDRIDVYHHSEGTLVLDFIKASDQELIWRGSAESALPDRQNPGDIQKVINKSVARILRHFPPSK
jgi:hypothetical protein